METVKEKESVINGESCEIFVRNTLVWSSPDPKGEGPRAAD